MSYVIASECFSAVPCGGHSDAAAARLIVLLRWGSPMWLGGHNGTGLSGSDKSGEWPERGAVWHTQQKATFSTAAMASKRALCSLLSGGCLDNRPGRFIIFIAPSRRERRPACRKVAHCRLAAVVVVAPTSKRSQTCLILFHLSCSLSQLAPATIFQRPTMKTLVRESRQLHSDTLTRPGNGQVGQLLLPPSPSTTTDHW